MLAICVSKKLSVRQRARSVSIMSEDNDFCVHLIRDRNVIRPKGNQAKVQTPTAKRRDIHTLEASIH